MIGSRSLGPASQGEIICYGNQNLESSVEFLRTRNRWNGLQVSFEMLMGEGAYRATNQQLNYPPEAYPQINEAALIAWKRLPTSNKKI